MISSIQEYLDLVERDDEQSWLKLRSDTASTGVWEEIILRYPDLKRAVTLNKTLQEPIIRLLAKDPDPWVRADIANLRRLPLDLFAQLAHDVDEGVRARIAWNKKTPTEVLNLLVSDPEEIVREPAKKRLEP